MDKETLLEMGFPPDRVELALRRTKGLLDAITWLDENADRSMEDLGDAEGGEETGGKEARSLRCADCGRTLKSTEAATLHAERTQHTNFEESPEEVRPLSEEEKRAKLEELRSRVAAKRAAEAEQTAAESKSSEMIRRKRDQESAAAYEELRRKELFKDAEEKKREKREEVQARQRIREQIEADKQARLEKAQRQKGIAPAPKAPPAATATATTSGTGGLFTDTRVQIRVQGQPKPIVESFERSKTLGQIAGIIERESGIDSANAVFTQTFPRKEFRGAVLGETLIGSFGPSISLLLRSS